MFLKKIQHGQWNKASKAQFPLIWTQRRHRYSGGHTHSEVMGGGGGGALSVCGDARGKGGGATIQYKEIFDTHTHTHTQSQSQPNLSKRQTD